MTIRFTLAMLIALAASPALAQGTGGDREPAGGAFNSSYTRPGSTGIQPGGPPRSADVPRPAEAPVTTGSVPAPAGVERREAVPVR